MKSAISRVTSKLNSIHDFAHQTLLSSDQHQNLPLSEVFPLNGLGSLYSLSISIFNCTRHKGSDGPSSLLPYDERHQQSVRIFVRTCCTTPIRLNRLCNTL